MNTIDPLLRRNEVERLIGLKRSALYKLMQSGGFPKPVRLSARAVAWRQSEVAAWIENRETA